MKRATILLAAVMAAGAASVTVMVPAADARKQSSKDSQQNDPNAPIRTGMSLTDAEQAVGGTATAVGAPKKGIQEYRISVRDAQNGGGVNDHPVVTVYIFGVTQKDGTIAWVRKQK